MVSSFLRRAVLRHRFRSQNLIPSLRSLSSDSGFDYKSIFSSDPLKSVQLIPDDTLQAVDSVPEDQDLSSYYKSRPNYDNRMLDGVQATHAFVDYLIRCEKKTGIIYKALNIINHHSIFDGVCTDTKLEVLSTVFDRIRNSSLANNSEVYLMNIFIKSLPEEGKTENMTKDEVISEVLNIVQSYPKVGHYKVTQETNLCVDLGFYDFDCDQVQKALCLVFKICVPMDRVKGSCKESIDYILNDHNINGSKKFVDEAYRDWYIHGRVFMPGSIDY